MMNLFGYIIVFTFVVILVLMMRVIFFLLREEQAVEIELPHFYQFTPLSPALSGGSFCA
jgi:Na+-transporting methylmalonyl-CoA/oxaloacetate decarboxylase gamma subunit